MLGTPQDVDPLSYNTLDVIYYFILSKLNIIKRIKFMFFSIQYNI